MFNVSAVIVTYNPDYQTLNELIDVLHGQVHSIYIVDNGSNLSTKSINKQSSYIIELGCNMGIAYAQNVGIHHAKSDGAKDVILFDQDSIPSSTLVSDLLVARSNAEDLGYNVAAVGPVHVDSDNGKECVFVDTSGGTLKTIRASDKCINNKFTVVDFLIASGALISLESLRYVGGMEERLFIDCVDIEWGFRAKSLDYLSIVAVDAKMHHKIGETSLKIFGRELTTHHPIRHYYFFRNFYHLAKREYVPSCWKRHVLIKSSIQAIIFCLFLPPRIAHFKSIVRGVFDALRGKYGQYQ